MSYFLNPSTNYMIRVFAHKNRIRQAYVVCVLKICYFHGIS